MITACIDKIELKKHILKACIKKQQSLLEDFQDRLSMLLNDWEHKNEVAGKAPLHFTQHLYEIDLLNDALIYAHQEMHLIKYLNSTPLISQEQVELGAVVITESDRYIISISTEPFIVNGNFYTGLSTHSPLFEAMEGKKQGDTCTFKGISCQINDVF